MASSRKPTGQHAGRHLAAVAHLRLVLFHSIHLRVSDPTRCRAIANDTQKVKPCLFAMAGELPRPGVRLFYSAGNPTKRESACR